MPDWMMNKSLPMARLTPKLKPGRCQTCGFDYQKDEELISVQTTVCKNCCKRFTKIMPVRLLKEGMVLSGFYCDWCLAKCFRTFTVNVKTCYRCTNRIGYKHQHQLPRMRRRGLI